MDIIFDPTLIALKQNISHAEEAIELAGSLLARRQICSAEYVNEMLTVYEDFGAAIVRTLHCERQGQAHAVLL